MVIKKIMIVAVIIQKKRNNDVIALPPLSIRKDCGMVVERPRNPLSMKGVRGPGIINFSLHNTRGSLL